MTIKTNTIVKVSYDLYVNNLDDDNTATEELFERAPEAHPMAYIHGLGMMLPEFEKQMEGKQEGDDFDFRIAAADAYGEYDEESVLSLPKNMFEIDGKFDSQRVKEGNIIPMNTADGQTIHALVVEVGNEKVIIDLNHPLAGEDLHFIGKIIAVKEATEEELQALTKGCGGCGGCGEGCGEKCGDGCGEGCDGCN